MFRYHFRYHCFTPENASTTSLTEQSQTPNPKLIVMPNILGGSLWNMQNQEQVGDLGQRAQELSTATGAHVLAYERATLDDIKSRKHFLGLPKAYDPKEYVLAVAEEGRRLTDLQRELAAMHLYLVGVSAGAERGLALTAAGMSFNGAFLYDPIGMVKSNTLRSLSRWGAHQLNAEIMHLKGTRPEPNQHRLPYKFESEVSGIVDMALHRAIWNSDSSYRHLRAIASDEKDPSAYAHMHDSKVRLLLPDHSFTAPSEVAYMHALVLNARAKSYGVDLEVELTSHRHWATDDPKRLSKLVLEKFPELCQRSDRN